MTLPFDDWLRGCAAAGKGGPDWVWSASRGLAYAATVAVEGDHTGASMAATVRAMPDSGTALAEFSVSGPVVAVVSGTTWSTFSFTLAAGSGANSTGSLPVDATGEGLAEFALVVTFTPSGGSEELFAGGTLCLLGV